MSINNSIFIKNVNDLIKNLGCAEIYVKRIIDSFSDDIDLKDSINKCLEEFENLRKLPDHVQGRVNKIKLEISNKSDYISLFDCVCEILFNYSDNEILKEEISHISEKINDIRANNYNILSIIDKIEKDLEDCPIKEHFKDETNFIFYEYSIDSKSRYKELLRLISGYLDGINAISEAQNKLLIL